MKFSKEDHILLVKLMYELITIPNLEPHLVTEFGATLIILLKYDQILSAINDSFTHIFFGLYTVEFSQS